MIHSMTCRGHCWVVITSIIFCHPGLEGSASLWVLQLSFNRISTLSPGDLSHLRQLKELHLQHNLITSLHPQMFQELAQLRVRGILLFTHLCIKCSLYIPSQSNLLEKCTKYSVFPTVMWSQTLCSWVTLRSILYFKIYVAYMYCLFKQTNYAICLPYVYFVYPVKGARSELQHVDQPPSSDIPLPA